MIICVTKKANRSSGGPFRSPVTFRLLTEQTNTRDGVAISMFVQIFDHALFWRV